ncbi:hypothetical protein BSL78_02880 [Apostichopus japonicus]|uniref:tRNA (adenine(58)-N(1))-methyltransferase non-catalytic subunit TRM6 n=1 Tax=Stichopus japonicus TaxID=307972 RepID=A0A2G8LIT8_STIJA|nr:hypothetical protein BSL78_02880 [Apostichopus japonicus]
MRSNKHRPGNASRPFSKPETSYDAGVEFLFHSFLIRHLRPDTLAQLMTSSNIQSGSKVIIVEHCQGLVVAAALERLAGKGNLVHLHTEDIPVITVEESFDFPKEYTDIALRMQLQYFYKVLKAEEIEEDSVNSNGEKKEDGSEKLQEEKSEQPQEVKSEQLQGEAVVAAQPQAETIVEPKAESLVQTEGESIAQPQAETFAQPQAETFAQPQSQAQLEPIQRMKRKHPENAERVHRRKMREENNQKIANLMNGKNMDVLIVACRYRPTPIVTHLLEYLAPSRSLVVYSSASEPLVECYNQLRESGQVINMRFSETWLREYQVLENRTHPLVNMSGTGGTS